MKSTNKKIAAMLLLLIGLPIAISLAQSVGMVLQGPVYFRNANIKVDANSVGNLNKAQIANRTRFYEIPYTAFTILASGLALTAASVPGAVAIHGTQAAEWAQGESTHTAATFRVPADYVSGQTFICTFSLEAASADTTVQWQILVNRDNLAFDAAATSQTAVAMPNETTKMHDLSLVTVTDTFQAGDVVSFEIWRAAGTGAGSLLELYGCYLSYTADM